MVESLLKFLFRNSSLVRPLRVLLVIILMISWIFSGWPSFFNFPPKIHGVRAITTSNIHASAYTNTTGFNDVFTNPGNAYSSDNVYATVTNSKPRNKEFATNFRGFDFSSIPAGSTINSVTAYIEKKSSASNTFGEWRTSMWEDVTVSAALTMSPVGAIENMSLVNFKKFASRSLATKEECRIKKLARSKKIGSIRLSRPFKS